MSIIRFCSDLIRKIPFQSGNQKLTPDILAKLDAVLPGDFQEDGYPAQTETVDEKEVNSPLRSWDEVSGTFNRILWNNTYDQDTPAVLASANPDYLGLLYSARANAAAKRMHSYSAFEAYANSGFRWGVNRDMPSFLHPLMFCAMMRCQAKMNTKHLWKVCESCLRPVRVIHDECPFCAHCDFRGGDRDVEIAARKEAEGTMKGFFRNDWDNPATWDGLITARPYKDERRVIADPFEVVRQTGVPRISLSLKFTLAGWPALGSQKVDYSWCRGNPILERNAEEATAEYNQKMEAASIARRFERAKRLGLLH